MSDRTHICLKLKKTGDVCGLPVWSNKHGQTGEACWTHAEESKQLTAAYQWNEIVDILYKNICKLDADKVTDAFPKSKAIAALVSQYVAVDRHLLDRAKVDEFAGQLLQFQQKRAS